jgi:hypothetical protein
MKARERDVEGRGLAVHRVIDVLYIQYSHKIDAERLLKIGRRKVLRQRCVIDEHYRECTRVMILELAVGRPQSQGDGKWGIERRRERADG